MPSTCNVSTFRSHHFPNINFLGVAEAAKALYQKYTSETTDCKVNATHLQDAFWGGDRVVEIYIQCTSNPLHRDTLVAHFPCGRQEYTARAAAAVSLEAKLRGVRTPKYLGVSSYTSGDVDCIVCIKEPGKSLDQLWPTLNRKQRKAVIKSLANDMMKLFCTRETSIMTYTTMPNASKKKEEPPVLLSREFDFGPLLDRKVQPAVCTTKEYLEALADRVLWLFDENKITNPWSLGWPGKTSLSIEEKAAIRATWTRLRTLIPHYTGGKFIPPTLSPLAAERARSVMSDEVLFGIVHTDLKMSRILVDYNERGELQPLMYTGWEHVHTAPEWSCARMPRWLMPGNSNVELTPITEKERTIMNRVFYREMTEYRPDMPGSRAWPIAYAFGHQERFLEALLGCHWKYRDTVEEGINILRAYWESAFPTEDFPIPNLMQAGPSASTSGPSRALVLDIGQKISNDTSTSSTVDDSADLDLNDYLTFDDEASDTQIPDAESNLDLKDMISAEEAKQTTSLQPVGELQNFLELLSETPESTTAETMDEAAPTASAPEPINGIDPITAFSKARMYVQQTITRMLSPGKA